MNPIIAGLLYIGSIIVFVGILRQTLFFLAEDKSDDLPSILFAIIWPIIIAILIAAAICVGLYCLGNWIGRKLRKLFDPA